MKQNCNCKSYRDKYIDNTAIRTVPWEDADSIWGYDNCGNTIIVDKPDYDYLTDEEKVKVNIIRNNGIGNEYLADDGNYYEINFPLQGWRDITPEFTLPADVDLTILIKDGNVREPLINILGRNNTGLDAVMTAPLSRGSAYDYTGKNDIIVWGHMDDNGIDSIAGMSITITKEDVNNPSVITIPAGIVNIDFKYFVVL